MGLFRRMQPGPPFDALGQRPTNPKPGIAVESKPSRHPCSGAAQSVQPGSAIRLHGIPSLLAA
jgi:hypothetical protein